MKNYHIAQINKFKDLDQHLESYSQLEKIVIYRKGDNEYIIDGFKRVAILSYENTEKIVFDDLKIAYEFMLSYSNLYDSSVWKIISILNKEISQDELHLIITKYINISSRDLWKLLQINYTKELEALFLSLNLNLKEICSYYILSYEDIFSLMNFFIIFQANKNNRKYFFEILYDLSKTKKKTIRELLLLDEIKNISNSNLQNNDKVKKLKEFLFSLRNPNLFEEIDQLNKLKSKLKLPGIKIELPINMESSKTAISFNFKNLKDLNSKLEYLSKLSLNDNFLEILNFLKKR